MVFNKVWQCGHCGGVFEKKEEAVECCGGFEELSYQCSNKQCMILYNENIKGKCPECGI